MISNTNELKAYLAHVMVGRISGNPIACSHHSDPSRGSPTGKRIGTQSKDAKSTNLEHGRFGIAVQHKITSHQTIPNIPNIRFIDKRRTLEALVFKTMPIPKNEHDKKTNNLQKQACRVLVDYQTGLFTSATRLGHPYAYSSHSVFILRRD